MFLVLTTGCGGPANVLDHGTVVDKSYDDPDEWVSASCVYYQGASCAMYSYVTHTDPPHWSLKIHGYDKREHEHTEWHDVTEETYDQVHRGDRWQE